MLPAEIGWLVSAASITVNLFLLVLNLKVSGAIATVKLDIEQLRTEMQRLRADMLEKQFNELAQVMQKMRDSYMDRETSMDMHADNRKRMEAIEARMAELIARRRGGD